MSKKSATATKKYILKKFNDGIELFRELSDIKLRDNYTSKARADQEVQDAFRKVHAFERILDGEISILNNSVLSSTPIALSSKSSEFIDCSFCKAKLARDYYIDHVIMHSDIERPYTCAICHDGFFRPKHLVRHLQYEHEDSSDEENDVTVRKRSGDTIKVVPNRSSFVLDASSPMIFPEKKN